MGKRQTKNQAQREGDRWRGESAGGGSKAEDKDYLLDLSLEDHCLDSADHSLSERN